MLPTGFNRADGVTVLPGGGTLGTPNADGALKQQFNGLEDDYLPAEESPDSPEIERAEQATFTHKFTMDWEECLERIGYMGRGRIERDSFGNKYLVLSAKIQHRKGGVGDMTVVSEAKSFDSPPDEFRLTPVELGVSIMKHPRYFYAFLGDGYGSTTELQNQMVIRFVQDYMDTSSALKRDALIKMLMNSIGTDAGSGGSQPPTPQVITPTTTADTYFPTGAKVAGTEMAKRAACEILTKYWRGEETPYLIGYQLTYSRYFFLPPLLHPGGVVQDPITEGNLPDYFWSTTDPPDPSETVFDSIPFHNPQCYTTTGRGGGPLSISWLRKADELEFQRTWFKLDSTWLGAPTGIWDQQLYTYNDRPQNPNDYQLVKISA